MSLFFTAHNNKEGGILPGVFSIDSKRENWLTALKEENLSWGQLLDRRTPSYKSYSASFRVIPVLYAAMDYYLNVYRNSSETDNEANVKLTKE